MIHSGRGPTDDFSAPMKILIVHLNVAMPDRFSGDRRLVRMIRMLSERHEVHYCARQTAPEANEPGYDQARYERTIEEAGAKFLGVGRYVAVRAFQRERYDAVFFQFFYVGAGYLKWLRLASPATKAIIDACDVHYLRELAGVASGMYSEDKARTTEQRELAAYRASDAALVVTEEEREAVKDRVEGTPVYVIPNIEDGRARPDRERERRAIFVGSFGHHPNLEGFRWFVEKIWPEVRRRTPDAALDVVGSRAPDDVKALNGRDGITVHGYVPDLDAIYDDAMVSLAPLLSGGGIKGKVTQAMGYRIPVVGTDFAFQGLPGVNGEDFVLANEPEPFAVGLAELLTDPARAKRMGERGYDLVMSVCGADKVQSDLEGMLQELIRKPAKAAPNPMGPLLVKCGVPLTEWVWSPQMGDLRKRIRAVLHKSGE